MSLSKEEANALLQGEDFPDLLGKMSESWQGLTVKLSANQQFNLKEKSDLRIMNNWLSTIAQKACPDVFRERVEQSVVKAWLGYAIAHIKQCTTNRKWIATGKLQSHENSLLDVCVAMMFRAVPVTEAFDSEFFQVLADFVKARKGTGRLLPCPYICKRIVDITCTAYVAIRGACDKPWTAYNALKQLKSTGILEQYIRCATVPDPTNAGTSLYLLDAIQLCACFFCKRVKRGKSIGDAIIAIVEGKGRDESPNVLNKLRRMVRISDSIQCVDGYQSCRNCGKSSDIVPLFCCDRCYQADYCSEECQLADRKSHKPFCLRFTEKEVDAGTLTKYLARDIIQRHYVHIMVKMAKACQQTGLPMSDMVVGLDFDLKNEAFIVPAMQDPPELTISSFKDHGLLRKKSLNIIKATHDTLQPNAILFVARHQGVSLFGYKTGRIDPITKKEFFSQEAVLAFQSYVNDHDDGPLADIFEPEYLANLKWDLAIHYGEGALDE